MSLYKFLTIFVGLFSWSAQVLAAACCGGSSATPSLITGDEKMKLTATLSHSTVVGDVSADGTSVFRGSSDIEQTQTLKLDPAILITDRIQAGASLPFVRRQHTISTGSHASTGLGDIALSIGYELLPEWNYSKWIPRIHVYVQSLFPTGNSIYETQDALISDVRGRGFFSLSSGAVITKTWNQWDGLFLFEGHRAFNRTFEYLSISNLPSLTVKPGWGMSTTLGLGVSPDFVGGKLRFGVALGPHFEQAILVETPSSSVFSQPQLAWDASATLSWLVSPEIGLNLAYTDQTLFGPASNVALSRTVALLASRFWLR